MQAISRTCVAVRRLFPNLDLYGSRLPVVLCLLDYHVTNREDSAGRIAEF